MEVPALVTDLLQNAGGAAAPIIVIGYLLWQKISRIEKTLWQMNSNLVVINTKLGIKNEDINSGLRAVPGSSGR